MDAGAVTADSVDAIVDFCVRYDGEYETNGRFSSAADRLLASLSTDAADCRLIHNMLRESLRV